MVVMSSSETSMNYRTTRRHATEEVLLIFAAVRTSKAAQGVKFSTLNVLHSQRLLDGNISTWGVGKDVSRHPEV
jgi:hypothetical protein